MRGWTARLGAWLIALSGLVLLVVLGCSDPIQRYETLSIFFDGVPPPEGYGPAIRPEDFPGNIVAAKDKGTTPVVYFYHKPYVTRQCFGCHDQNQGNQAKAQGVESCRKCHQEYFELSPNDWMHGPVVLHECTRCHLPHRSPYEGLLTKPQRELCMECHQQSWVNQDPLHSQLEDQTCSRCHDPHAAGNRLLLVDARTFERRKKIRHDTGSIHPVAEQGKCVTCHINEESNRLLDNVEAKCAGCHEKAIAPGPPPLHKAVADGKCLTCHTAHRSPRPTLIRPTAERVCFQCHKPEEVQTLKHPHVTRVDCLVCHSGHRELRPHMLRDNVDVPPIEPLSPPAPKPVAAAPPEATP
jgi:predicted CXXCH cytochrome family protein